MLAGLQASGVVDVDVTETEDAEVLQSYQPSTQGVTATRAVYFTKLPMDRRYGWPEVTDEWNDDQTEFVHRQTQLYETTLQIAAMLKEDPDDTTGLTASDLGNIAAAICQSAASLAYLAEHGLSVLRITDVRSGKITDGEGEFETLPTFDFVLLHEQVTVTTTPAALIKSFAVKHV